MTLNLFQTSQYKALMEEYLSHTILYLFEKKQEFAIACETYYTTFTPELPHEIRNTFSETVLFVIGGYTFESANIDEEHFVFEAGFGHENIGATVTIPLLAIKQIFVEEHPILINLATPELVQKEDKKIQNSMEALLKNPENKKLLKKKL